MDIFAERKKLVVLIVILAVMNVLCIGVYLWQNNAHHKGPELFPNKNDFRDVSAVLKKELNLTDKQVEFIDTIRASYFIKEEKLKLIIRNEKDSMNLIMFNKTTDENLVKSLAKEVADNEYKMELMRYEQSKELKAICSPVQLDKFEKLVLEIRDYFRPDNQPKRK